MPRQLDILALEPFYGGVRRAMLETVVRYSRHRWTVLKLPPRRIERRLSAAANWFSEQLGRHWVGRLDLLFTSEAMNLASLYQLMPQLIDYPSIVYFHDNQLPDLTMRSDLGRNPLDLVNLNTCQAATEIWFNSSYHKQTFLIFARAIVERVPELMSHDPIAAIRQKLRYYPPPVDLAAVHEMQQSSHVPVRRPRSIFVETRGGNLMLFNAAMERLRQQNVPVNVVTVGPVDAMDPNIVRTTISEYDDLGQIHAMLASSAIVSIKPGAASDYQVVRALAAGCRPILPDAGVYPELLPDELHKACLYPVDPDSLADRIALAFSANAPPFQTELCKPTFKAYDAMTLCRMIDERIEQLVAEHPAPQ